MAEHIVLHESQCSRIFIFVKSNLYFKRVIIQF